MTDPIYEHGRMLGTLRLSDVTKRLADVLANDVPRDVTVSVADGDISLTGKNLVARYATDVRLNGIVMTAKAVLS